MLNVHTKDGLVFMVQVDHLSGESIGQSIEAFYQAGASNVQVVSSITKKNRPGYIVFIDCRPQYSEAVEKLIVSEYVVGGWHVINTKHRYLHSEIVDYPLDVISSHTEDRYRGRIKGKIFEGGTVRPEHDSVVELQKGINRFFDRELSYNYVYVKAADILTGVNKTIILD